MLEMLDNALHKRLSFMTVLMDSWYASMQVIKRVEALDKLYYCPFKTNRQVDDSEGEREPQRVDKLLWSNQELTAGKTIHLKKMPKGHRVKLFRLVPSTERKVPCNAGTDYVITNDITQDNSDVVRQHCGVRWKIERFHREAKQVTGLDGCQCRIARALRNHIACSFLVWAHLKRLAQYLETNVYQLKFSSLDDYMRQQLKHPSIPMVLRA